MLRLMLLSFLLPAMQAAGAPAPQSIASAYAELNHPDFQIRLAARQNLMALSADQLPRLRQAVAARRPTPAQISALRRIVTGVILKSEPYDGDPRRGFLGIRLDEITLNDGRRRVIVQSRLVGFVAYRSLCDGDIILAVIDGRRRTEIDNMSQLQQAILGDPAGKSINLLILRGGRITTISVTLDALPAPLAQSAEPNAPPSQFNTLQNNRLKAAQAHWDQFFAPLCGKS